MTELFGSRSAVSVIDLPSHLAQLSGNLPPGSRYTVDKLIGAHTLFPLYEPFLPLDRAAQLRRAMAGTETSTGSGIHMRAGIMASSIRGLSHLRYCPSCVLEDRSEFGECYWHAAHQVPGVLMCAKHHFLLEESSVPLTNRSPRYEFVSTERALGCREEHTHIVAKKKTGQTGGPAGPRKTLQSLRAKASCCSHKGTRPLYTNVDPQIVTENQGGLSTMANNVAWLLDNPQSSFSRGILRALYVEQLVDLGFVTSSGRIRAEALTQALIEYFGEGFLKSVSCSLDPERDDHWLARLVRHADRAQHPLHHLLLIGFIGRPVSEYFAVQERKSTFGIGPWPCLNSTAKHFQELVIDTCHVKYSASGRRPVATFACSCGFSYCRVGPDLDRKDRFKVSWVKAYGAQWETTLVRLWEDPTVSLRALSRSLGVDPTTARRHAERLNASGKRRATEGLDSEMSDMRNAQSPVLGQVEISNTWSPTAKDVRRSKYRNIWLEMLRAQPSVGVTVLRRSNPAVYYWLYRNDRDWLVSNGSPPKKLIAVADVAPRINWATRDIELRNAVEMAARDLLHSEGRPVQLTVAAIGRAVGHVALIQQHLSKLPQTQATLIRLVESRVTFACRRIHWAIRCYQQDHEQPSTWQLVKRSGVARIQSDPTVAKQLADALQMLQAFPLTDSA
jgi:hypothetical protein